LLLLFKDVILTTVTLLKAGACCVLHTGCNEQLFSL